MAATSFLSLFSGCGGLDIGLESIGWRCAAQSEIDKDCVVLLKHRFPDVPNLGDVTKIDWSKVPPIDALVGGFPCQDLSYAGRGAGLAGARSGLYYEMIEAIRQVRPRLILIENVPGLLGRGLHVVTHDLARAGYAGTWRTLAAADVGAPHRRERVFVIGRLAEPELEVGGSPSLIGNFAEEGWEAPQTTLLGAELLDRMPKAGAWTARHVYEFEIPDDEGDEILLLPTPQSSESTPTEEFIDEMREAGIKPDERLYLPGRKSFSQRTLSRIIPALLPTPGASDANGGEGETRDARRREGDTGGPSLRDLPKLLPTPQGRDAHGPQGNAYLGQADDLPAAASRIADGPYALLPTPTTQDGENCGGPSQHERNTPPLNAEVTKLLPTPTTRRDGHGNAERYTSPERSNDLGDCLAFIREEEEEQPVEMKLLPTPVVTDSFGSRRSTARTEDWESNPGTTLTDAIWETQGRTEDTQGKLLPTPRAADGENASEQGPRYYEGEGDNPTLLGAARRVTGETRHTDESLLPTPQASDGSGGRLDRDPETLETGKRPSGTKASVPLATAIDRDVSLLPTPTAETNRKSERAMTSSGSGDGNGKRSGGGMSSPPGLEQVAELATGIEPHDLPPYEDLPPETRAIVDGIAADSAEIAWGHYEPAIRRWEGIVGRPAPLPTDEKGRLSPAFVEWMLGFPAGWVDLPGARRTAQLRMLGNSVQVQVAQIVGLWLSELGS